MKSYPSKILLFGEYAVIFGAPALAVPYRGYTGTFVHRSPSDTFLNYIDYIVQSHAKKNSFDFIDIKRLDQEVRKGLDFHSDIPRGYGLGSSGALCAAILDRFGMPLKRDNVAETHKHLSELEHYFHGQSSGLDPLVSYFDRPIYRASEGNFKLFDQIDWQDKKGLWLINLERSRKTQPLVQWFNHQMEHPAFKQALKEGYVPLVHSLCGELIDAGRISNESLQKLSRFQWNHFRPLIPDELRASWKSGLEHNKWTIKLCGAGGGGMMLLFADPEVVSSKSFKWELIPVYPESLHHS